MEHYLRSICIFGFVPTGWRYTCLQTGEMLATSDKGALTGEKWLALSVW